jgi:DNA-binding transcriptional MerR regulator
MDAADQLYTLSDAAALSGVAPATIRQYELDQLIRPRRDSRNTRLFSQADIEAIKNIRAQRQARHGATGPRLKAGALS